MYYNQTNQFDGIPMPLLMGFTYPEPIQQIEDKPVIYDPVYQIVYDYEMKMIGTKSLKEQMTRKPSKSMAVLDRKNEIDDSKYVK